MSNLEGAVNDTIREYLYSENFIGKDHTECLIRDAIDEATDDLVENVITNLQLRDEFATVDYVDENCRQMVIDEYSNSEHSTYIEELVDRVSALEQAHTPNPLPEPKTINQLDQFVKPAGFVRGYEDFKQLGEFITASLNNPSQKTMVIAMVLATARNIIQEQLNNDHSTPTRIAAS
jgi:hypothetical protein